VGGSSAFGKNLNGVVVDSLAAFNAAVALLRTPAGHDINNAGGLAKPAQWATVEEVLATTDTSEPSQEIDGNPAASVASLATINIIPLVVTQISCKTFDFTVDSPDGGNATAYFKERWELYKHQYVLSRWTYMRGIRKIECARLLPCLLACLLLACLLLACLLARLRCGTTDGSLLPRLAVWNEPDLTAGNNAVGALCMSPWRWTEQYTVRSQAIQNAYADFNADVAAGRMTCPAKVDRTDIVPGSAEASTPNCPFNPLVTGSAFASRTFEGSPTEYFGGPSFDEIHTLFPPYAGVQNATWWNMHSYSYHSYGCARSMHSRTAR
jgi:hypothetical protein